MGFLDTILSGAISVGQQAWQNNFAKKEAEKNRQFQSDEAELNRLFQSDEAALQRDWSAQEAERVRAWNEEMYEKYNSLSGKIAQAEQAGVNPLFAVTGNAVTPGPSMSGSPSGASSGSVGTPSGATATSAMVDLVGNILGFSKLKSEIELTEAQADRIKAETPYSVQKLISEIANIDIRSELTGAQIDNVLADTRRTVQNTENLKAELNLSNEQAEQVKAATNKLIAEFETINSMREPQKRSAEAKAAVDEFDASLAQIVGSSDNSEAVGVTLKGFEKIGSILLKILLKSN